LKFSQADYKEALFEAKIFTNGMNDEARKATRSQYDETIQKIKLCHQGLFPLLSLRRKMLCASEEEEGKEDREQGVSKKARKGKSKKNKSKGKSPMVDKTNKEGEREAGDEKSESESNASEDEEVVGNNATALEYIEKSIEKQRKLDVKLRERLEVLYVALSTNWKYAKKAETLQQGDKGKSLLERTVKAMNEEGKKKRDGDELANERKRQRLFGEEFRSKSRGRGGTGGYSSRGSRYGTYGNRGGPFGIHNQFAGPGYGFPNGQFGPYGEGFR
jgi:hypothetical protein